MANRITWPEVKLGEHVDLLAGFAFKSARFTNTPGDLPLVKGENLHQSFIDWKGAKRWPASEREQFTKFLLQRDDVVLAMDRPWIEAGLKYSWIKERDPESLLVQRVARMRGTNGLDTRYLRYIIGSPSFTNYIRPIVTGVNVPHISPSQIKAFSFPLPPQETQSRTTSILSAYDDLMENNSRRIAILEEMARRIYEEWFIHFRFPGNEAVKMVESELGPVPEGWEALPLEEVCSKITDGAHHSPKTVSVGKAMASVKDMHDWGIHIEKCRKISEEDYRQLVRQDCKPRVGDVLIAKDGSYLKHTFAVADEEDVVLLSSIAILRPNERYLPELLAIYLKTPQVMARMKGYVSGVAIPRIVLRDFRKFKTLTPPIELQERWFTLAGPMLAMCRNLIKKNRNLRTQRDLLLPKLISGEIDVSNLPEPEVLAA